MEISSVTKSKNPRNSTVFTLSTSSDLKILVTECSELLSYDESSDAEDVSEGGYIEFESPDAPIADQAIFYVKESALDENNVRLEHVKDLAWRDKGGNDTINLGEESIKGIGVWLATFHDQVTPLSTMFMDDIWSAIKVCAERGFDRKKLQPWFKQWVDRIRNEQSKTWNDVMFNRQLLFPCHFFDDAVGFQQLTKFLVYNTNMFSPIKESKPFKFDRGDLSPKFVIKQLNAVREDLRTVLQRRIFAEVHGILEQSACRCNDTAICTYLKEIDRIGIKPWGATFYNSSIKDITDRLELFDPALVRKLNVKPCHCKCSPHCGCSIVWDEVVKKAHKDILGYFDGLCLDCTKHTPNEDSNYWKPEIQRNRYDQNCRINHGEKTWYFSFMGQRKHHRFERDWF
ncbi:unnamed protein product [Penicillium glandicola]